MTGEHHDAFAAFGNLLSLLFLIGIDMHQLPESLFRPVPGHGSFEYPHAAVGKMLSGKIRHLCISELGQRQTEILLGDLFSSFKNMHAQNAQHAAELHEQRIGKKNNETYQKH